jgi:hypothetical protein
MSSSRTVKGTFLRMGTIRHQKKMARRAAQAQKGAYTSPQSEVKFEDDPARMLLLRGLLLKAAGHL